MRDGTRRLKLMEAKFAGDSMGSALSDELFKVTLEFSEKMAQFMASFVGDPELTNTFRAEVLHDIRYSSGIGTSGIVSIAVGSDHWKAFIENYGMGSEMANSQENKFLSSYQSSFFHSHRSSADNAITAREEGNYWRPNWESGTGFRTDYASGRIPAGTNLETSQSWTTYKTKIRPQKPKFFMEHAFTVMRPILEDMLRDVIKNFDYSGYWRLSR